MNERSSFVVDKERRKYILNKVRERFDDEVIFVKFQARSLRRKREEIPASKFTS